MDRQQKEAQVAEIVERLGEAEAVFAIDYRGISVTQAKELRTELREAGATFNVVKNRLAKLAADESKTEGLETLLVGPTALTFVKGDPVLAAKALAKLGKDWELLEYKGGLMEGSPLDADGFKSIARLPGREILHGQLVGLAASPLTGIVRGLGSLVSGLAIQLGQIAEQGLVGQGTEAQPSEEPAAEEPQAEAEAEEPAEDEPKPEPEDEQPAEDADAAEGGDGENETS